MYNFPMSKYYTGKGDDGTTGLLGKGRVPKYDARIEAVGAIDETTAALGAARALNADPEINQVLKNVQRDLYQIMSSISATPTKGENPPLDKFPRVTLERVSWLEEQIDIMGAGIALPREFILPGDNALSAAFAVARTVTRRAERRASVLKKAGLAQAPAILPYLNRLSSLCFLLELRSLDDDPTLARDDV